MKIEMPRRRRVFLDSKKGHASAKTIWTSDE